MQDFVRRFARHWFRAAISRSWAARDSFGVRCFVLIWLVVWCMPFLRLVLVSQTARGDSLLYPTPPWAASGHFVDDTFTFSNVHLHNLFPDDRDVQLSYAETSDYAKSVERYDAILKSRPNDTTAIAGRLRNTLGSFRDDLVAGALEETSPFLPTIGAPIGPISKPTPAPTPTYTKTELGRAITVAQNGRKLEPQNNFYDWALIYFLLCAHRDNDAFRVLDTASRKTHYDDHLNDSIAATIRAQERVRPLLVEEKYVAFAAALLPHLAKMRHAARLLSWKAWQLQGGGDFKNALEIRSDLARLSHRSLNQRGFIITSLVARGCVITAWDYDLAPVSPKARSPFYNMTRMQIFTIRAANFSRYAAKHGRADLSSETQQLLRDIKTNEKARLSYEKSSDWGLYSARVMAHSWFGMTCLAQIGLLLAAYLVLTVFLLGTKPQPIERAALWKITTFAALCAFGGFLLLLQLDTTPKSSDVISNDASTLFNDAGLRCWGWFILTPAVLGTFGAFGASWRRTIDVKKEQPTRNKQAQPRAALSPAMRLLQKIFFLVCISTLFYALSYTVLASVMSDRGISEWDVKIPLWGEVSFWRPSENLPGVWGATVVFLVPCWLLYWRRLAPIRNMSAPRGLYLYRQIFLALVPFYSVFWVLIALLSIAPRQRAESKLNDCLQHGELYVAHRPDRYR